MTIWLASGNKHKQQELSAILGGCVVKLPADMGITDFDPLETGTSFAENALIKAKALYQLLRQKDKAEELHPVLADDSGLCVDILGGRPGIYSARYYGKSSWNSDGSFRKSSSAKLSDTERNLLLLEEIDFSVNALAKAQRRKENEVKRNCRFICAMVLLFSPEHFYLVQETMEGEIVSAAAEIRGSGGFGYDPIVCLPELERTVAELSEEEKNNISHRAKAGRAIAKLFH